MLEFIAIFVWLMSGGIAGGVYAQRSDKIDGQDVILIVVFGPASLGILIGSFVYSKIAARAPDKGDTE